MYSVWRLHLLRGVRSLSAEGDTDTGGETENSHSSDTSLPSSSRLIFMWVWEGKPHQQPQRHSLPCQDTQPWGWSVSASDLLPAAPTVGQLLCEELTGDWKYRFTKQSHTICNCMSEATMLVLLQVVGKIHMSNSKVSKTSSSLYIQKGLPAVYGKVGRNQDYGCSTESCPQPDLSTQHAHLSAQFSLSHVSEPTQNADHGQGLGNPLKHPIAFAPNWYPDPEVEPDAKNHACSGSVQEIQVTWNTVLSDLTTYIWAPRLDWSTSSSFLGCPIQVPKLFNWLYLPLWSHSKGLD